LGSRDVIGHVTIRLAGVDFLWVVHGDWNCYGDMAPHMLGARTLTRKKKEEGKEKRKDEGRKGKGKVEGEKK